MKKILAIGYSQSGQLHEIMNNFLAPLSSYDLDVVKIKPETDFQFPWSSSTFFDAMPETVLEKPIPLTPYTLKHDKYDLIILGYQPWFLSPSLPITSLLKDPKFTLVLKDTKVITLIGGRNMWINAQIGVVKMIEDAGGIVVANVPLMDRVQNHVSAVTIVHWMFSGKKTKKWGIFPLPGVSQKDIDEVAKYSAPIAASLEENNFENLQKNILSKGGINIESSIMLIEARAKKLFLMWANFITKKGTTPKKRAFWVGFFKEYLAIALFAVSPPVILIHTLLKPLMLSKIEKNRQQLLYLGIKK